MIFLRKIQWQKKIVEDEEDVEISIFQAKGRNRCVEIIASFRSKSHLKSQKGLQFEKGATTTSPAREVYIVTVVIDVEPSPRSIS